jgi:hypothetical protein
MNNINDAGLVSMFAWDDKGKRPVIDVMVPADKVNDFIHTHNVNMKLAVGYCINRVEGPKRTTNYIPKHNNVFLDLDQPTKDKIEYDNLMKFLSQMGIVSLYSEESLNGYHIVIPVNIDKTEIVKNFIMTLKKTFFSIDKKVFIKTQIARCPDTISYKNKDEFRLTTLTKNKLEDINVEKNTQIIQNEFYRKDINFFENIIKNKELIEMLKNTKDISKNDVLIKNLAIFTNANPTLEDFAFDFVEEIGHNRAQLNGWMSQKLDEINYKELYNWAIENQLYNVMLCLETTKKEEFAGIPFLKTIEIITFDDTSEKYYLIENNLMTEHSKTGLKDTLYAKIIQCEDALSLFSAEMNAKIRRQKIMEHIQVYIDEERTIYAGRKYKPIDEREIALEGNVYYNTFFESELLMNRQPYNNEDFPNVKKLLGHLTDNDEAKYNYFCKWLGFQLQNPTTKLATSIIFKGTQGTGKGTLAKLILKPIFGHRNISIATNNTLNKGWGSFVKDKRLVICEEVSLKFGSDAYQMVKDYSANSHISVECKFKDDEIIENYSHWLFFTNEDNPFKIEKGDRRHTIFHQDNPIDAEVYINLVNNPQEVINFMNYLLSMEISKDEVNGVMMTAEKEEMIFNSSSSSEKFVVEIKKYCTILEFLNANSFNYEFSTVEKTNEIILATGLYKMYEQWCYSSGLGRSIQTIIKFNKMMKKLLKHQTISRNRLAYNLRLE